MDHTKFLLVEKRLYSDEGPLEAHHEHITISKYTEYGNFLGTTDLRLVKDILTTRTNDNLDSLEAIQPLYHHFFNNKQVFTSKIESDKDGVFEDSIASNITKILKDNKEIKSTVENKEIKSTVENNIIKKKYAIPLLTYIRQNANTTYAKLNNTSIKEAEKKKLEKTIKDGLKKILPDSVKTNNVNIEEIYFSLKEQKNLDTTYWEKNFKNQHTEILGIIKVNSSENANNIIKNIKEESIIDGALFAPRAGDKDKIVKFLLGNGMNCHTQTQQIKEHINQRNDLIKVKDKNGKNLFFSITKPEFGYQEDLKKLNKNPTKNYSYTLNQPRENKAKFLDDQKKFVFLPKDIFKIIINNDNDNSKNRIDVNSNQIISTTQTKSATIKISNLEKYKKDLETSNLLGYLIVITTHIPPIPILFHGISKINSLIQSNNQDNNIEIDGEIKDGEIKDGEIKDSKIEDENNESNKDSVTTDHNKKSPIHDLYHNISCKINSLIKPNNQNNDYKTNDEVEYQNNISNTNSVITYKTQIIGDTDVE